MLVSGNPLVSPPVDVAGHHVDDQPVSEPDGVENHLKVGLGLLLLHVVALLAGQGPPRLVLVLQWGQDPLQQVPVPTTPVIRLWTGLDWTGQANKTGGMFCFTLLY